MHQPLPVKDILRESAIVPHAASAGPVWVFDMDGSRLLFANPAAAALLGYPTCAAATAGETLPAGLAAQIEHVGPTLTPGGHPRLARLRGLGLSLGRALTCACSTIDIGSQTTILARAVEEAGPSFSLAERARRLIEDRDAALAAFGPDGTLLHATAEATQQMKESEPLSEVKDRAEIWSVGANADTITLALFPGLQDSRGDHSAVDLAPIADAMASMQRAPAAAERRHPLRFVWETDADNRFTITTEEFLELAGPRTINLLGRFWGEISAKLALDPEGLVAHAMMSRDTWSGLPVQWPAASGERIAVELSGIPAFDRERLFLGYRGFGVLRDAISEPRLVKSPAPALIAEPEPVENIFEPETIAEAASSPAPAEKDKHPGENVVPFRGGQDSRQDHRQENRQDHRPVGAPLNPVERTAFVEIGSRLAARLKGADELARGKIETQESRQDSDMAPPEEFLAPLATAAAPALRHKEEPLAAERPILDRLPTGILIYRLSTFLYANTAFLKAVGHASLGDFAHAGGLDSLFIEPDSHAPAEADGGQLLRIASPGQQDSIAARLFTAQLDGENVMVLLLTQEQPQPQKQERGDSQPATLASILDIAADGVVIIDRDGKILQANSGAERLFGYQADDIVGRSFGSLFAPESEHVAMARLHRLAQGGETPSGDETREIIGRRQGGLISLHLILGCLDAAGERFCAVFRDITRWKDAEQQLVSARQQAEKASNAKSEFLAKISHEMRTPLNAIIGFSEVMMEERFGPVGNERYRDYLKDINTSGSHLVSLLNDLLDLSKIEAGKMELSFERVNLNELTQQSVAIMQPQAARARVVVRSALSMTVPDIIADARSVRQIVLNLLSNSIKFTGAGGQVIVSTAATTERGEVMLRVRDTGIGMSSKDIEVALQPFRQLTASPRSGDNGTGLGLPLTKALVEANRARFSIKSAVNAGTLVEIVFPAARVLPE